MVVFRSARILLAQELAKLLPAATNSNHYVASKDANKDDQFVADLVFTIANSNHGELSGTGTLTKQLYNLKFDVIMGK